MERSIDKEFYFKAKESLLKLVEGVPIKEDGELIGWVEKPDVTAIKYAIDTYKLEQQIEEDGE